VGFSDTFKGGAVMAYGMSNLLNKMDPMVRKLESAMSEFKVALANNDLVSAEQFLRSINATADFLADDVTAIYKSQTGQNDRILGVNDRFAGGAPVMQFNSTQGVVAKSDRPMGYIGPDRIGGHFKKQGQV
tara:strand:+ start:14435 stop:14827 length:393 start_codon:yes stop_codon:yes gene_type:complete